MATSNWPSASGSAHSNPRLSRTLNDWLGRDEYEHCSGQPIPDSGLSFSSATAGGNPSLN
ncbi:hypothetical protein C8257_17675 [Pseudomonas aeruginosa]|nr:hypothetical protein C8257_17675 [Pseudomonas aeruginosa]